MEENKIKTHFINAWNYQRIHQKEFNLLCFVLYVVPKVCIDTESYICIYKLKVEVKLSRRLTRGRRT